MVATPEPCPVCARTPDSELLEADLLVFTAAEAYLKHDSSTVAAVDALRPGPVEFHRAIAQFGALVEFIAAAFGGDGLAFLKAERDDTLRVIANLGGAGTTDGSQ